MSVKLIGREKEQGVLQKALQYFLSTFGLQSNENSIGLVTRSLTMDVLFEKV